MPDDRVELFTLDQIQRAYEAWRAGDVPQSFPDMMRDSGWFMADKQSRDDNPDTRALDPSIESLQAEVAELRKQRLMILTAVYPEAPKFVATICDESLDRSGALLGEVRELARQALAAKEQTR